MNAKIWSVAVLLGAAMWAAGADEGMMVREPEVVVLDDETIAAGKRNVENVVASLQSLLMPSDQVARLRELRANAKPQLDVIEGANGRSTLVYQCRYNRAEWMLVPLEILLQDGLVEANNESNQIIINDLTTQMPELQKSILAMDRAQPQVLLEARVVEFIINDGMQRNLSFMYDKRDSGKTGTGDDIELDSDMGMKPGIQGSAPNSQGLAMDWYPYISGSGTEDINVAFQWLLTAQDAKLLSSPNIVVSSNTAATIKTGQDLPIQQFNSSNGNLTTSTKYKSVGVKLLVEPKLINANSVLLRVNPDVSNVARYERFTQNNATFQVPVITVRSIDTELMLENGQIVMIGGLYDVREAVQQERTPFLSDLPWLGELFTSKSTSHELVQLIFFLRVHILNAEDLDRGFSWDPSEVVRETEELKRIFEDSSIIPKKDTTLEKVEKEFIEEPARNRAKAKAEAEAAAAAEAAAPVDAAE